MRVPNSPRETGGGRTANRCVCHEVAKSNHTPQSSASGGAPITDVSLQSREERDKQREETLLVKDKEKEMDAIKVCHGCVCVPIFDPTSCVHILADEVLGRREEEAKDEKVGRPQVCV